MPRKKINTDHTNRKLAEAVGKIIGSRLREIRVDKGYTQSDVAKLFDLTLQQIQKYEKGENRLSAAYLLIILDYLNTTPEAFFRSIRWKKGVKAEPIDDRQGELFS